jgi:hypothetical protein
MKNVVIAFACLLALPASAAPMMRAPAPMPRMAADFQAWECGLIQVSPPDRDRDPGFKINLVITPDSFSATHTAISGATYVRDEQYKNTRSWNEAGALHWSGRSARNPQRVMVGTFGQNRATGRMQYVEKIYNAGMLETVITSNCHHLDGETAEPALRPSMLPAEEEIRELPESFSGSWCLARGSRDAYQRGNCVYVDNGETIVRGGMRGAKNAYLQAIDIRGGSVELVTYDAHEPADRSK